MDKSSQIEELFLSYGSDVYHFLVYYLKQNDVEDLVQEVFTKALKGWHQYEGRSCPRTWLFTIARRTALDHERKRKLAGLLTIRLMKERKSFEKTPDEILFQREELRAIYAIVNELKRSYRDVLLLRVMQDFTVGETAEILNWSKTRVNVTLHRALRKVCENYVKIEGGEHLAAGKP